jgi:hypothetical protein
MDQDETESKPALLYLIRELLVSRSANSSFWRFGLQSALFALNVGHVEELFKPEPIRRQGNPIRLLNLKVKALQHVHFLVGKGHKKYRALHTVAEAIGHCVIGRNRSSATMTIEWTLLQLV